MIFLDLYDLFLNQGNEKTSISDIAKKAGVAKGTFYLYFADKYEIRDRLIARTASRLFQRAHKALETADIPEFEDKIIFIVDYVLNAMQKNKLILRFISKNLSWGIFRQAITNNMQDDEGEILAYFSNILLDHPTIKLRAPETMLFLIIELASSTSYSTILDNDPMSFEELKPYLNEVSARSSVTILSKIPQKIKQQKSCQNPNIKSGFLTGLFYIFFPCQLYF